MTKRQLIGTAKVLGLKYYNECENFIYLEGINGHASILYTSKAHGYKASTMEDFVNHIKMMGRDSLRIELNHLLSITSHI